MDGESSRYDDKQESMLQDGSSEPHNLPLKYLRSITNNFSDERLLGQGGFGTVYKGVLQNGKMIAVKKFNLSIPGAKDRQFDNEANHLMRLKHRNVVRLIAWCSETESIYVEYNGKYVCAEKSERLLCLEYMPKGNLRGHLSDEALSEFFFANADEFSGLGWGTRYKIIEGICYGLRYLHEECQISAPIVHMDLKPANILLDSNMAPKIADFGLSRLFSEEKTWTCTRSRDGTLGYMSPEYINKGLVSTKSDIFSLGVIIIEIVTGRRDYPDDTGTPSEEFIEMVLHNWSQRKAIQFLFGVSLEVDYQQIRRCIQIGLDCVKNDRSKRPTISQIIKALHRPESADSSNIKGVNRPQSGKRKRNCGETSLMERPAKKHTPGLSIYETFTVALHQRQKKTAFKRIRVIFTTVMFVVLLKRRAVEMQRNVASSSGVIARSMNKQQTPGGLLARGACRPTTLGPVRSRTAWPPTPHRAAARIQSHFRTWQIIRSFMNLRRQAIKIQAAYRGHQVRRQYRKVLWSVGVVEKAILRWRKKRKGLRGIATGMPVEMATDAEAASTAEEDYYQVGRQQAEDRFNRISGTCPSFVPLSSATAGVPEDNTISRKNLGSQEKVL